jgi:hypothetical protein
MWRHGSWGVLLILLGPGLALAQGDKKPAPDGKEKGAAKNNEVEVRFGDGSNVRMLMLQESIDVETKYGKLTVPTRDIRGIDLGIHLPEGAAAKIEAAIKRLNSPSFKERDQAVNDLVELGAHAYPALMLAAGTSDLEAGQRVQLALKRIRARVPADYLRTNFNDRIITTDFPISGRILSTTLKAKTPYFGELDLKLAELRSIQWLSGQMDREVVVESKWVSTTQWLDTGIVLEGHGGLHITATGEIDLLNDGSGEFLSTPAGTRNIGGRRPGGRMPGTLIGKIGETGPVFTIGERYQALAAPMGKLYLQVVPVGFNNGQQPSGSYKVTVKSGYFFDR